MRRRILIADDEPSILKAFRWAFEPDYEVLIANDGKTAVSLIQKERPGLIVLDWRLKGELEGRDVLLFSKKECPGIPVYVVTASVHFLEEIKSLGADACFLKPCPDLREKIMAKFPP
jgi:DNA-binding response OmpR family regulator